MESLPCWTILPNWRDAVTERLEWLTAVLPSQTGSEQTFGLRQTPRRTFEFMVSPHRTTRTLLDLAVGKIGFDPWYLPLWHDAQYLAADVSAGATSIAVDTADREFTPGGVAMVLSAQYGSEKADGAEAVEIATVASGSITLVGAVAGNWPKGCMIAPVVKARLTDMPAMSKITGRVAEATVRFEVVGASPSSEAALPTYRALPVLSVQPDVSKQLTAQYERLFDAQDNQVGVAYKVHTSDVGFVVQSHNWLSLGRSEHAALRAMFYTLAGRNNPIYVPTFDDDFIIVTAVASGDSAIEVENVGFTYFGGPRDGRRDIQIALKDGTILNRRISGSSLTPGGTETIVLTETLPAFSPSDVERVSFLARCRMDSDSVELTHLTDSDGVTQAAAVFRVSPPTRVSTDYEVVGFGNTTQTDALCGAECIPGMTADGPFLTIEPPTTYTSSGFGIAIPGGYSASSLADGSTLVSYVFGEAASGKLAGWWKVFSPSGTLAASGMAADGDRNRTETALSAAVGSGFVVVNYDVYPTVVTGASDLKARSFNSSLSLAAGPTQIGGGETSSGLAAQIYGVAPGDSDSYYVAYTSGGVGATTDLKIVRRSAADHSIVAGPVTVLAGASENWTDENPWLRRAGNYLVFAYRQYFATGREYRWSAVALDLALNIVAPAVEINEIAPGSSADHDEMLGMDAIDGGKVVFVWWNRPNGTTNSVGSTIRARTFDAATGTFDGSSASIFEPTVLDDPYYNPNDVNFRPNSAATSEAGTYIIVSGARGVLSPDFYVSYYSEARLFAYTGVGGSQVQMFDINPDDLELDPSEYFFPRRNAVHRLAGGKFAFTYEHLESSGPPALEHGRMKIFTLSDCPFSGVE